MNESYIRVIGDYMLWLDDVQRAMVSLNGESFSK